MRFLWSILQTWMLVDLIADLLQRPPDAALGRYLLIVAGRLMFFCVLGAGCLGIAFAIVFLFTPESLGWNRLWCVVFAAVGILLLALLFMPARGKRRRRSD